MAKYVYLFTKGQADGDRSQRELLGGKGANLAEMAAIGLPVPSGFTLTTEVCKSFYQHDRHYPEGVESQVNNALKKLEQEMAKGFGDPVNPLLLSVRSGAPTSMPGMMDTVLNLGLNDQTVQGLINLSGSPRFAYDSYRRFIQMYANVVKGVDGDIFETLLEDKNARKVLKMITS